MSVVTAIGSSMKLHPQQLRAAALFDAMETKVGVLRDLQSLLPDLDASAAREVHGVIRSNQLAIQKDFAAIADMLHVPDASREDARDGVLYLEAILENPAKVTWHRTIHSHIHRTGDRFVEGLKGAADQAVAGAQ